RCSIRASRRDPVRGDMVEPNHPPSRERPQGRRPDVRSASSQTPWATVQPLKLVTGLVLLAIGLALSVGSPADRTPFAECTAPGWRAGQVLCATFAPDGRSLCACGLEGSFVVWDVGSRRVRAMSGRRPGAAARTALDPDGRAVAVENCDSTVTLGDLATGRRRADLPAHAGGVWALAFSRDGAVLASADDAGVRLWDAATGRPLPGPGLARSGVRCLAFAPDGRTLAAGDIHGRIRLVDPTTGRERACFRAHSGPLLPLTFSDDGRELASTNAFDGVARLWEAGEGRPLLELKGHS